jgi:hypothetical protein
MQPVLTKRSAIAIVLVSILLSILSGGVAYRIKNRQKLAEADVSQDTVKTSTVISMPKAVMLSLFYYLPFWLITVALIHFTLISKKRKDSDPRRA